MHLNREELVSDDGGSRQSDREMSPHEHEGKGLELQGKHANSPIDPFQFFGPRNASIDVFELNKIHRSTDFETL